MSKHKYTKPGIYKIKNTITGEFYIGSASSSAGIQGRWRHHKYQLRKNKHHSNYLQRSWNKYGKDVFILEVIEFCDSSICIEREQYWLDLLKPKYNSVLIASSNLGYKHRQESKNKMSESKKGNTPWNKGKKIGSNYKKDSFNKRKKTMAKNRTWSGRPKVQIQVTDENNKKEVFSSISLASKQLNIDVSIISIYSKKNKTYKGYTFKRFIQE